MGNRLKRIKLLSLAANAKQMPADTHTAMQLRKPFVGQIVFGISVDMTQTELAVNHCHLKSI